MYRIKIKNGVICMLLLLANAALAVEYVDLATEEGPHATIQKDHAMVFWGELDSRKRLNNFFPNEQGEFYGVQVNYVNVGAGNLTFIRRDLVRVDRIPIVFGRVYDSRITVSSDFGRGWKLTVVEMIEPSKDGLLYTDASNTLHELVKDGDVYYSIGGNHSIQAQVSANGFTLNVDGLEKSFDRVGDRFNLVAVKDQFGNKIEMRYKDGLLDRITSVHGRSIQIERDAMGRVSVATDDIGRSVSYSYDEAGRLVHVNSAGQGQWQISYSEQNYLARITDPRDVVVLEARFDKNGRAETVRVLNSTSRFRYSPNQTELTDGLDRSAIFWQAESGVTQTIRDVAGSTTHIEFDSQNRPTSFSREGEKQLVLEYGGSRQITKTSRKEGSSWIQRSLHYDSNGNLLTIHEGEELIANYAYTNHGLVASADDAAGSRAYKYTGDGRLEGVGFGSARLDLKTNNLGELEIVRNDSGGKLRLHYDDTNRVVALELQRPDTHYEVTYQYDQNGLRSIGEYSIEGAGKGDISFTYDEVGNLVAVGQPSSNGERLEYEYDIGAANEVLQVVTSEDVNYRMSYNNIGQLTHVFGGSREAEYEYDYDGNVNAVRVDERHVSWENAIPTASLYSLSSKPQVSGVFGTIDEIVYSRSRGTPFGPIIFSPNRLGFIVSNNETLPPDILMQTSLRNRLISDSEGIIDPVPLSFDKPSSLLFIPPEYSSVNCYFCIAYVDLANDSFTANGQSSAVVATNESVNFVLSDPFIACTLIPIWPSSGADIPYPWLHYMSFGDTAAATASGSFNQTFSHSYNSHGNYLARDSATCGCSAVFSFLSSTSTVTVCESGLTFSELSSCPVVIANGQPPIVNGCSAPAVNDPTSGNFNLPGTSTSFLGPCNSHDTCYDTCNSNKGACDVTLDFDANAVCANAYPDTCPYTGAAAINCPAFYSEATNCELWATAYGFGVFVAGQPAYESAQERVCKCCG